MSGRAERRAGDDAQVPRVLPRVGQQVDDDECEHRTAGKRKRRWQQALDVLHGEPCHERARYLRHARQNGAPDLLPAPIAGGLHRRCGGSPLGHVLDRDRRDDERAEADLPGGERTADRKALGQAMGEQGRR